MKAPRLAYSLLLVVSLGTLTLGLSACVSAPTVSGSGTRLSNGEDSAAGSVEDFVLVDCALPGRVRQLGTMMTYLGPRRLVKTTPSDCAIRGGEYVAFDRADYAAALDHLLPKARKGNAVAQTYVGEIYEKGLGLASPDYGRAADWYRKAAEQGHSAAQTRLGSLYERGLGVPADRTAALQWYRRASGVEQDELVFRSTLQAERAAFREETAKRRAIQAALQRKLASTEQRLQTNSRETTSLERQIETLRQQLADRQTASVSPGQGEQTSRELQQRLNSLEQELATKEQALAAAKASFSEQQSALTSQLREAQSRAEQLELEIEATEEQLDEVSAELQRARERLAQSSSASRQEQERLQTRIAELDSEVTMLEKLRASRKEQRDDVLGLLAQR